MKFEINDFRRAVDRLNWSIRDLQGHTSKEFIGACVDVRLLKGMELITEMLPFLQARFSFEREHAQSAIKRAQEMIERWEGLKAVPAPTVKTLSSRARTLRINYRSENVIFLH